MGWFNRKQTPAEPVYSELGSELYRLLEEKEGEWIVNDNPYDHRWTYGLHHKTLSLHIIIEQTREGIYVKEDNREGTPLLNKLLTSDDLVRIEQRSRQIMQIAMTRKQYENMKQALERIRPNPFDYDCRQLARAVLAGDASAARPLLDKAMETLMEHN